MAWPNDAVIRTYAANLPVRSADLNELQKRIVDLHRERYIYPTGYHWEDDISGLPAWQVGYGSDGDIYTATNTASTEYLLALFSLPAGTIIKGADIKYYIASAAGISFVLSQATKNFDEASAPPSHATIATATPGEPSVGDWNVESMAGIDFLVGDDEQIIMRIGTQDAGDKIAGVRLLIDPQTVTP